MKAKLAAAPAALSHEADEVNVNEPQPAPAARPMLTATGTSGSTPPADAVPVWLNAALAGDSVNEHGPGCSVVGSLAMAEYEPPPETTTWFVAGEDALAPTFTVTVTARPDRTAPQIRRLAPSELGPEFHAGKQLS